MTEPEGARLPEGLPDDQRSSPHDKAATTLAQVIRLLGMLEEQDRARVLASVQTYFQRRKTRS